MANFISELQRSLMRANHDSRLRDGVLDPLPVVKLYTLDAGAVWLLTELDADGDRAYGLCDPGTGFPELGFVQLSVLEAVRGPAGQPVVADPYFRARQSLSAYAVDALRYGSVND